MGIKHKCLCLWVNINTNNKKYHSVQHCGINPPPLKKKKRTPSLSCPLYLQTVQAPTF